MTNLTDQQIIEAVEMALKACWSQHDALQQLAMHYPEAHHVLSSPRKPDAIAILERLYHALRAATPPPGQEAAGQGAERGEGEG